MTARRCPPIHARPRLTPVEWLGALACLAYLATCGCGWQGPACVEKCAAVPHHAPLPPPELAACVEACAAASCVVGCEARERAR